MNLIWKTFSYQKMAVPVVIVGLREEIGNTVIQGLKPEWDGTPRSFNTARLQSKLTRTYT